MTVTRVFSSNPVSDTLLPQGTFNPDTITFDDGTFWTAGQDDSGVFLTSGDTTLWLFGRSDPAVIAASDVHGNKAANLAYVDTNGHVYLYREDVTGSSGYNKDIGAGYNPDVAVSGYAIHTAVAYQYDYSATDTDIFVSFRDESGNSIKQVVIDNSTAKDQDVHIANAYGGFLVTWNRIATTGATSVWYARYDFDGTLRQGPTLVDSAGNINSEPAVSDTRDARFAIAYEDNEFGGDSEIRLFTQGDGGVSTYTRVTNLPGRDHQAAMTELDGILAIAFTHDYLDGGDVRERDIYLALADANGNLLTDPAHPIVIAESESVKEHVSIDSFDYDKGQVIVSYYDPVDGQVHEKIVGLVETITGDSAANYLRGTTSGIVHIDGGAGNDNLTDSDGPDQLRGGANDDVLYNGKGDDYLDGGTGMDTVSMRGAPQAVTLAINLGTAAPQDTGVGMDTILNVENATGHSGADTLRGNSAANVLDDGGDVYSPSARDTLIGGGGNDTYVTTNATDIIIEDAAGGTADLVKSVVSFVLPDFVENLTLVDTPDGGARNNTNGTGNQLANFITGGIGDNLLKGLAGADTLIGGLGNDTLDGGTNPEGAHGQGDVMLGGDGNDTYYVDSGLDLVDEGSYFPVYGFGGNDTIISTADFYWDIASVGEALIVSPNVVDVNNDGVTIVGGVFNNTLIGHKGTDVLFGRGGSDTYVGGDGVDYISLSTLGVPDAANYKADGNNIVVVDPRSSGANSYDIIFEFDRNKDKVDVSHYTGAHDYTSGAQLLGLAVNDGAGNCYIPLGDGFDYVYFVGLTKAQLLATDFIV